MTVPALTVKNQEMIDLLQDIEDRLQQGFATGALAAVDTAGGLFAWQNTLAVPVEVYLAELVVTTETTGACTADVGMTATSAVTLSDNLIDGKSLATTAMNHNSIVDNGTNGRGIQTVAAGKWITGSVASGASAGIVGTYRIHYRKVETAVAPLDLSV